MDYPTGNKGRVKSLALAQLLRDTGKGCPGYEGCEAPVCPLSHTFRTSLWYPDEAICMSQTYRKEYWRVIQGKIAKMPNVSGFFTLAALNRIKQPHPGIKGLIGHPHYPHKRSIGLGLTAKKKLKKD